MPADRTCFFTPRCCGITESSLLNVTYLFRVESERRKEGRGEREGSERERKSAKGKRTLSAGTNTSRTMKCSEFELSLDHNPSHTIKQTTERERERERERREIKH